MSEENRFELEDDAPAASIPSPAASHPPSVSGRHPPSASAKPGPRGGVSSTPSAARRGAVPAEASAPESAFWARFPLRFRRRLKRCLLVFAVGFLLLGWLWVGVGLWAFPLVGALVGVFAAYRRSDEVVLGGVSAAAGYGACALAMHGPPLGLSAVVIVAMFGGLGALMAIDDRLGEDASKLLAAGKDRAGSAKR
jgi:hypothetical protein